MNLRALRLAPFLLVGLLPLAAGCDLLGSKSDPTTEEILDEGQVDPTLPDEVGYVPLNPFFTEGFTGPLDHPTDVYVGYDQLIYVSDRNGLQILDLAGRPQNAVTTLGGQPLRDITAIVQDRRLDVYVAARRDTTVAGVTACRRYPGEPSRCDLPVIYHLRGTTTGAVEIVDVIWFPFDDGSREPRFRNPGLYGGRFTEEDASFTGVAVLANNTLYATRSGPVNTTADGRPNATFGPFNAFLIYTAEGRYVQYVSALSPTQASLLSAVYPSDIATFVGPPQRASFPNSSDILIAQAPPNGSGLRYGVLSVRVTESPNGTSYDVDTARLNAAANPENGDGFLYDSFRFDRPTGIGYAADATGYIFVTDAGKDSLFVFNANGVEGVAPPPGAGTTRPVRVSFGGTGSGGRQFDDPEGVAYFARTVYVADKNNNRISRFRLNTDFE